MIVNIGIFVSLFREIWLKEGTNEVSLVAEMLEQYEQYEQWFPERVKPKMGARTSGTYVSASVDKPAQLHICSACGKRYKWLDSLRRHQRVEMAET
ncbi:Protein of unknown function [Cotesia congregata]|uniref:C2H2-type domain-containing protein n=1 Tax=Cotesia congregata TaxID=51543 RepID=A0A8J2MNY0_COTCN|nr:Protein of unknown function [Cotesia congregata]